MDPDPQSKSASNVSPHKRENSRDSSVYLTTCMIGHLVEVHLKNGSVYSGIFHTADLEKGFGIVLKMASLIKDGTLRGHKIRSEFFKTPPFKTFIIPAHELVQVVAEDLSVSSDGTLNAVQSEKPVELLTDSSILKSHHDDSGFDEEDDKLLDTCNDQTFGGSSTSSVQKSASSSGQKPASSNGKGNEDIPGDSQPSRNKSNVDQSCSISGDEARHLPSEQRSKDFPAPDSSISERRNNNNPELSHNSRSAGESVSGHGGNQVTDIKNGAELSGGGTSASKTVAESERQSSQVSGKTESESYFGQSGSRSSESRSAPSTPSRPGIPPRSSIGSLSSSEKSTLNPDAKFEAAMHTLPAPQSKSSSNESLRRRETSRDNLVNLITCMIGHLVEVHLKNGSVYSGIFHTADLEKDFGIVLKMASLIKDGTLRGHKSSDFIRKPPFKTIIIPADELVQVVAEDLSVSSDVRLNAVQSEKPVELLTDSSISKSRHVNQGRKLIPWEPDGKVSPGLDNVFNDTSKRGWNQFEVNASLFGVKSTFDEEQYTTKLSRSTWTRELEEKAQRIEREIEGENTPDGHLAEKRGLQLNEKSDIDEETKYSAVRRDDSRFDEEDDKLLDTCDDQTFGGSSTSSVQKLASSSGKGYEDVPFEAGMDTLPDPQSKSSSNVSPHKRETSRDSLVNLTTCMIGHLVEVHLNNGSVYSGIFHAADVEKDFGIVLKMASLIKDSTLRGHKSRSEFFRKPPFKTFIIPADELVQVVAEDLSVSSDGTLNTFQSEKPVELLTDSSSVQKPASSSSMGYEDGDSQPSRNNTNVDQSCSISGEDPRHLPSEQRSKDFPAPDSSISESQLGERRKNNNPEVSHSSRSAGESVSGHGGNQVTDIKDGAKLSGGGTSASKTVAESERQGSQVSGKPKSESSSGQSDSRSSESLPAPSTPSHPVLLPSSETPTLNPDAKEFKPSQQPTAVPAQSIQQIPVQTQSPMPYGSVYYYPAAPVQQMPGGYGIQPQYPGQPQMFYYTDQQYGQTGYPQQMFYYTGQQYGQTSYPQYAQAQYPQQQQQQQQMMISQPPRPPPSYQPGNPYN